MTVMVFAFMPLIATATVVGLWKKIHVKCAVAMVQVVQ
jgi:hypothetical protein